MLQTWCQLTYLVAFSWIISKCLAFSALCCPHTNLYPIYICIHWILLWYVGILGYIVYMYAYIYIYIYIYIYTLYCQKCITKHQWLVHSLYGQKYWDTPFFRREKALPNCGNKDGNIIHVLKIFISTSVATVLKCMKWLYPCVPICHWCLVMNFWLKVCI